MARAEKCLYASVIILGILSKGCDSKPAASPSPASPVIPGDRPAESAPSQQAMSDLYGTAVISGKISLADSPKPASGYLMSGDVFCAQTGKGKLILPDGRKVGEGGAVPFAFVYIKSGIAGPYKIPNETAVLDQKGCHYEPHVFGLLVNQPLEIRNSDPTAHNIHAQSEKNESFNIAQAQQGSKATKVFNRPEVMVRFKCDVHSWMEAYAGVLPHPFFAVSGNDGRFSISRLPAGEYVVEVWHEVYGRRQKNATITEGQQLTLDFSIARQP